MLISRNVTPAFLKFRAEHKKKKNRFGVSILEPSSPGSKSGKQRLLHHNSDDERNIELTTQLPPVWVDVVEDCRDDINKIKEKMSQLQKMQQKRLLRVFETAGLSEPDAELDAVTATITNLFKKAEKRLHDIKVRGAGPANKADYSQRQNAQMSIATQLQALNQTLRKQQQQFVKEVTRRHKGADFFETAQTPGAQDFAHQFMDELATVEQDEEERSEELGRIANSVAELHSIFKDLAVLVIDQGTVLDRIDYNVEQVVCQTGQAKAQLKTAEDYQQNSIASKVTKGLLVFIAILIAILFFKLV